MIYEMRTYETAPGRMGDLLSRFEHHTLQIWDRLGIRQAGFWTVAVGDSVNKLIYLLEWDSMAHREKAWADFMADPEWEAVRTKSERDGPILTNVSNAFLQPTAFSHTRRDT